MNEGEDRWKMVQSDAPQLSFALPPDWQAIDVAGNTITVLAPENGASLDYRSNVTIAEMALPQDADIASYGDSHLAGLERLLTDFRLLEVSEAEVGGRPGVRVTGTFRQGAYDLTLDEWLGLTDTSIVTAAGLTTNATYPEVMATFERIVESISPADA